MKNNISKINVREVSHVTVVTVFQPMLNSGWQIPAVLERVAYNYTVNQKKRGSLFLTIYIFIRV